MKYIFLFTVCLIFTSCLGKNDVPAKIIQQKEMQNILWDILRAQALAEEIAHKDSSVNEVAETKVLNEKIFKIHNIAENDFNESYAWYTNHPDVLKIIFDSLSSQNQRENDLKIKEKHKPFKLDSLKRIKRSL